MSPQAQSHHHQDLKYVSVSELSVFRLATIMGESSKAHRVLTGSEQNKTRVQYGGKAKKIKDRIVSPKDFTPMQRPQSSWGRRQKIRVLDFLFHPKISIDSDLIDQSRPPTEREGFEIYKIPQTTISE